MEFELINTMLTLSVSNLFTNKSKHEKYFINEDINIIDKADIPKSSTKRDKNDDIKALNNNFVINTNTKPNNNTNKIYELSNDSKRFLSLENPNANDIADKLLSQGYNTRKKLKDSLRRLNISKSTYCNFKDLSKIYNLNELEKEKSKVKSELQKLDESFNRFFKRYPVKQEKEIYRPLYVYYISLKDAICYVKNTKEGTYYNYFNFILIYIKDNYIINKTRSVSANIENEAIKTINNKDTIGNINKNKLNNNHTEDNIINKYKNLEKDLINLKRSQSELKAKLQQHQEQFYQINNRKVKYHKDIEPVEYEYNLYKQNRNKIKTLEDIINKKS